MTLADPQLLIEQLKRGEPSILLVDDDLNIVTGLKDILEDSGYTVSIATNAGEARDLLGRNTFSTMITDYSLPDDNGVNLSRDAKKAHAALGLILMTGHDPLQIEEKVDEQAIKFLRKPVAVTVLLDALDQTIQRQCDALNIGRRKPIPVLPIEDRPVQPLSEPAVPAVILDNRSTASAPARSNWTFAMVGSSLLLLGFVSGWVGRDYFPLSVFNREPSSVSPNLTMAHPAIAAMPLGPANEIGPIFQAATPMDPPVVVKEQKKQPSLKTQLANNDPAVRFSAAKALLKINPEHSEAIAVLLERMDDPSSRQRLLTIEALSTTGASTPHVIAGLGRALRDHDPSVVYSAATALGHLGKAARPALRDLQEAIQYNDGAFPSVTQAAKRAIDRIGEPATAPVVVENDLPKLKQPDPGPLDQPSTAVLFQNKAPAPNSASDIDFLSETEGTQAAAAPKQIQ